MTDIHKGGRPPIKRPEGFYEGLLREYETMTIRQMAESGITVTTVAVGDGADYSGLPRMAEAVALLGRSHLISKGILLSRTAWRKNTVIAVERLIPSSLNRISAWSFSSGSIRIQRFAVLGIIRSPPSKSLYMYDFVIAIPYFLEIPRECNGPAPSAPLPLREAAGSKRALDGEKDGGAPRSPGTLRAACPNRAFLFMICTVPFPSRDGLLPQSAI